MLAQAKVNKEWAVRLIAIGVLFIGFGSWFVYDGIVVWPAQVEKYKLVYDIPNGGEQSQAQLREDWRERLAAAGHDTNINPKDLSYHSDLDVTMQFVYAGVCFPIGLLSLIWLFVNSRRKLYADEDGVTFGCRRLDYDQITGIDKSRWDSKGIAVLESNTKSITLDDWKFKGAADVLEQAERNIGMGGSPMVDNAAGPSPSSAS